MAIVGRQAAANRSYFPAPLDSLDASELGLDLYIRTTPVAPPALYRSAGLVFKEEDRERLLKQGIEFLYISVDQHAEYKRMLSTRVSNVLLDQSLTGSERREIVSGICGKLIEDAVGSASQESVNSLFEIGDTIAQLAANEGDAVFSCLLNMSGHDFYTATHMINVSIGCGLLARAVKPRDLPFTSSMIQAGLVHDLGKSDVPAEILNKEGRLNDEEFQVIKAHPMSGVRTLRELGINDPIVIEVTRDHHEHMAGTGYPRGVDASRLSVAARIAAIVDVYDALTSARPYRAAIAWNDALEMMDESRSSQFDPEILDKWKAIVASAAVEHASDLPTPTAEARSIDDIMPHDLALRENVRETKTKLGITTRFTGREKRQNERVTCNIRATVAIVGCGGDNKSSLDARLLDISRCGIRFACHQRFVAGTTVHLRASMGSGKRIDAIARIVRPSPEANRDGLWEYGCSFVKAERVAA